MATAEITAKKTPTLLLQEEFYTAVSLYGAQIPSQPPPAPVQFKFSERGKLATEEEATRLNNWHQRSV